MGGGAPLGFLSLSGESLKGKGSSDGIGIGGPTTASTGGGGGGAATWISFFGLIFGNSRTNCCVLTSFFIVSEIAGASWDQGGRTTGSVTRGRSAERERVLIIGVGVTVSSCGAGGQACVCFCTLNDLVIELLTVLSTFLVELTCSTFWLTDACVGAMIGCGTGGAKSNGGGGAGADGLARLGLSESKTGGLSKADGGRGSLPADWERGVRSGTSNLIFLNLKRCSGSMSLSYSLSVKVPGTNLLGFGGGRLLGRS
ncbi:hypothetical protein E2C01_007473 [Portunus trituberculatus]|uniref:Uncharacterized protein n=1 Tax=Portunus trituberculatus TaxID=210409 RepID=A0A5B7CYA4_PORTR|nr:hypothetical protein [Portunus trituberculatus]